MAHFKLPISFEFNKMKAKWTPALAHLVGWRTADDGSPDLDHVVAEVLGKPFGGRTFTTPVHSLPLDLREVCEESQEDTQLGEILGTCVFDVLVNTISGESPGREANPWIMREEFLAMSTKINRIVEFLNRWGYWRSSGVQLVDQICEEHEQIRRGLSGSAEEWLIRHSPLPHLYRRKEYPHFFAQTDRCAVAVMLATTIDFLTDMKFGICARPDCRTPYRIESKHGRDYCRGYCAHLESMRRSRAKSA
jgi:hypothetical protein